jgi:hypothetical protein
VAENALLEKMLDLPEFTITDLQHNYSLHNSLVIANFCFAGIGSRRAF